MQNNFSHPRTKAIFVGCVRALLFRVHFFRLAVLPFPSLEIEKKVRYAYVTLGLVLNIICVNHFNEY